MTTLAETVSPRNLPIVDNADEVGLTSLASPLASELDE